LKEVLKMAEDRKAFEQRQQNIILKDRRRLMVSGVRHVESFNEENIVLDTELGILVVRGIGLHINKLNVETSELDVEGDIGACEYLDGGTPQRKGGFFSGLFR
jgi:sporulation protein YabP